MKFADSHGVKIAYESVGKGTPVLFVHEFAGDSRSWDEQVRALSRKYRCVTFNARGYPPSEVPAKVSQYSQQLAVDDMYAVMQAAGVDAAHVVGLSMGGYATLHFGLQHPRRVRSLVISGCGYGSIAAERARFQREAETNARLFETLGMSRAAARYALGPYRLRFRSKDPDGWRRFAAALAEHSAVGSAMTMRGVQKRRPSVLSLGARMARMRVPALVIVGDEDEPCLEPGLFMKRTIPGAGLLVVPRTGHTVNLEEPKMFNGALLEFFSSVDAGHWSTRPVARRSGSTILGPRK